MLIPRYFFAGDFSPFYDYFLSCPHVRRSFPRGSMLWQTGEPHSAIHYIENGSALNFALHESGRRKLISFHGAGTVFPGYHRRDFKIERALATQALCDMQVLEFTREQFSRMFAQNTALAEAVVSWYAAYVNRLLFETVHQEYNSSLVQLCNLLYLLTIAREPACPCAEADMTQDELAELLGISRVQLTRALSVLRSRGIIATQRHRISITNQAALAALCSSEALGE